MCGTLILACAQDDEACTLESCDNGGLLIELSSAGGVPEDGYEITLDIDGDTSHVTCEPVDGTTTCRVDGTTEWRVRVWTSGDGNLISLQLFGVEDGVRVGPETVELEVAADDQLMLSETILGMYEYLDGSCGRRCLSLFPVGFDL